MSDQKPENPPAFPQSVAIDAGDGAWSSGDLSGGSGMTLRDYYAAKAMAAMVTAATCREKGQPAQVPEAASISLAAYVYADAMLAARENGEVAK